MPRSSLLSTTERSNEHRSVESRGAGDAARRGLVAGLVATLVMTAFRLPIMRSLPPTANVAARVAGGEPEDYPVVGLVLHLCYGAGAGVAFAIGYASLDENTSLGPEERGILWGGVFGLALSVFGAQVVLPVLARARPGEDETALFHAAHLVYGLALGAWVGSRTRGVPDEDAEYEYEDEGDGGLRRALPGQR